MHNKQEMVMAFYKYTQQELLEMEDYKEIMKTFIMIHPIINYHKKIIDSYGSFKVS